MTLRELVNLITNGDLDAGALDSSAVLNDEVKFELEDQVYLDAKEVYFLRGTTTIVRVTGKSLVCGKGHHNLCPNAKSWCACTCHEDDVEGLTPR